MKQYKVLSFFVDGDQMWDDELAGLLTRQSENGWTLDHITDTGISGLVLVILSRETAAKPHPIPVTYKDQDMFKVPVKMLDGGSK